MKIHRSAFARVAAGALALAALGMTAAAQAGDVYWSIGLSSPGVQVGVANAPPVIVHQPVYSRPYPVYRETYPVYWQPPVVYVAPRPVIYVQPAPFYMPPPRYVRAEWKHHGHRNGKGRYQSRDFDDEGSGHRGKGHGRH